MSRQVFHDNSLTLFVAAFEPFGGRSCNTSADLLQALRSSKMPRGIRIAGSAILPVNFATAWPTLRPQLRDTKPDLILLMGEKKGGSLTIESLARNTRRDGTSLTTILADKPEALKSQIHIADLFDLLRQRGEKRFQHSENAGDFLCNYIYFMTLLRTAEYPTLFVHVPAKSPQQFRLVRRNYVEAICNLVSVVNSHHALINHDRSDTKAIDGAGTNDMPRENQRRLLMADKHLVACEQEHEMVTVLKHFKKGSSKENIDKMQNACRSWKKDGGAKYKPKNRDNFYKYLQEKGVLGKLS